MSGFNGAVEGGVLHGYDVVNNLTSTATNQPLSAAQGKMLNDKVTQHMFQAGYASITDVTTTEKTVTVNFATNFTYAPHVLVTLYQNSFNRRVHVKNITTSGFDLVGALESTTGTAAIEVQWAAFGVLP